MTTIDQIHQDLPSLSEAECQLVAEFIQLLKKSHTLSPNPEPPQPPSFLDVAGHFVGILSGGPGDLATNPHHLEGFGASHRLGGAIAEPNTY
jgi:hypothetical protein